MRRGLTCGIALAFTLACKHADAPASSPRKNLFVNTGNAQGRLVRLPSGEEVRVYSIGRIAFPDKSHPPSLLLRYETNLEPRDSEALRAEVMAVWELLRPQCDAAGDSYAMVMANEPVDFEQAVTRTESFTYGFVRSENGSWRMREPKAR